MSKTIQQKVSNKDVLVKIAEAYSELFSHDGYGDLRVEMKILRRGQKEVIIHCGKQHRFIVDYQPGSILSGSAVSELGVDAFNERYVGPDRRGGEGRIESLPKFKDEEQVLQRSAGTNLEAK